MTISPTYSYAEDRSNNYTDKFNKNDAAYDCYNTEKKIPEEQKKNNINWIGQTCLMLMRFMKCFSKIRFMAFCLG